MKAVVLLLLALAAFAVAEEQTVAADVAAVIAEQDAMEMPSFDVYESEEEADIEGEAEDEEEEADEESDEEADEESDESEEEAESFLETESDKPKKPVAIVAPAPLKAKPFKFHPERVVEARTTKYDDPEMAKLDLALAAVKEDILSTNKQITDERKWVIAVAKIIASYNDKMKRVEGHIIALRKEMKALYRKKKQIENLKLQRALEAKLKEAKAELATLTSSLSHVAKKQGELNRSGSDLRVTINGIQAQLAKLRGQNLRKPKASPRRRCGKGRRWSKKSKKCVVKGRNARKARKSSRRARKF